jgi:hypothetical protein
MNTTLTQKTDRKELTANQVAEACGNSDTRLRRLAAYFACGEISEKSWYECAAYAVDELNHSAHPDVTLQHILAQIG